MRKILRLTEVLIYSKKIWRWCLLVALIIAHVLIQCNSYQVLYEEFSLFEVLFNTLQNPEFAVLYSVLFVALITGDAARQNNWETNCLLRIKNRRHWAVALAGSTAASCLITLFVYIAVFLLLGVAHSFNISDTWSEATIEGEILPLYVQQGLTPISACMLAAVFTLLRWISLGLLVLLGNLASKKIPIGILLLLIVGLALDYQAYDVLRTHSLYILPYDHVLLEPRDTRLTVGEFRPVYFISLLYFLVVISGLLVLIFKKIKKIDFQQAEGTR